MRALAIAALLSIGACGDNLPSGPPPPDAARLIIADATPVGTNPPWPAELSIPSEFDFPPWVNMPAAGRFVVSWRTVSESTGVVRYGKTRDYGRSVATTTSGVLHHVELGPLEPATAYHYRVEIDGTAATRLGVFVTPGAEEWRFVHLAEFHAATHSTFAKRFTHIIRAFRPHVIVESGDMLNSGSSLSDWRSYMRTSAPWISNAIILPASSNHVNGALGSSVLTDLFVLPNNERWYDTRYGGVQFFTLDSTFDGLAPDVNIDEPAWLAQQSALTNDGEDDPDFVVGAWHYPACSTSQAFRSGQRNWVMDNFVNTFTSAGGIDLILVGHDKYYERSLISGGIPHVQSNIGLLSPGTKGSNHEKCQTLVTNTNTRSMVLLEVNAERIIGKAVDEDGFLLDEFELPRWRNR